LGTVNGTPGCRGTPVGNHWPTQPNIKVNPS